VQIIQYHVKPIQLVKFLVIKFMSKCVTFCGLLEFFVQFQMCIHVHNVLYCKYPIELEIISENLCDKNSSVNSIILPSSHYVLKHVSLN
jgi:hypothetical protein